MKEILSGDGFENGAAHFHIEAKRTYHSSRFDVWELEDAEFTRLCSLHESDWNGAFGWWRYAKGCNIEHYPVHTFSVNGKEMLGWYDEDRLADYVSLLGFSEEDYFAEPFQRLTAYLSAVIGVSTETNICAVSVGLARLNNITLSGLFEKYEPKWGN